MRANVETWEATEKLKLEEKLGKLIDKTVNDILTPLRGAFNDAMADRVIDFNLLDHVKNQNVILMIMLTPSRLKS